MPLIEDLYENPLHGKNEPHNLYVVSLLASFPQIRVSSLYAIASHRIPLLSETILLLTLICVIPMIW